MSQKVYLHIKEPCHENWEAMSPVEQGRFCNSCAKQVVDFSRMSDRQILDLLSKAAGKTCGRFSGSQLERPVLPEIPYSLQPYKIVLSSLVPLFIMAGDVSGQNILSKGEVAVQVIPTSNKHVISDKPEDHQTQPLVMGKIAVTALKDQQPAQEVKPVVQEHVINKNNKPLPPVTVVKSMHKKYIADSLKTSSVRSAQVKTSTVATPAEIHKAIATTDSSDYLSNTLDPVIVTGFTSRMLVGMLGSVSIVKTVNRADTAKTFVQKLFNNDMFRAFPNPAHKGQHVQLSFRKEGDYIIQLFDNSGRLYIEEQVSIAGKDMVFQLAVPATTGSGIYYLKAVNTSTKKNFIEKIIVQ